MKRFFLALILTAAFFRIAIGSDDITLMGNISPLFYLETGFSEKIITSDNTELTAEVSDIAADAEHIFVRFYITDLPASIKSGVTDDSRIYGSYLPVAEIFTQDGHNLTPSSASRFSLLEYNSRLIIGGLLVFNTDQAPQAFYLNFNQIPFDTQPLAEGFSRAIVLDPAKDRIYSGSDPVRETGSGLEFGLTAAAQTNEFTMLQPSVRLDRPDEVITKFGWITVREAESGKRFAVTRGNLYGFNLADDSDRSPAHAYVFLPAAEESPILVSMENAYVRRSFEKPVSSRITLKNGTEQTVRLDDEFVLTLTDILISEEKEKIRLYISSGDRTVSDISFSFPGISSLTDPPVSCGVDTQTGRFACDIFFTEAEFPKSSLDIQVKAVEYRKDGPWTIAWNPVPMDSPAGSESAEAISFPTVSRRRPAVERNYPESVRNVLEAIDSFSSELIAGEGWIHEEFGLDYQFREDRIGNLIPVDQADQYFTEYISENWYLIGQDGQISERIAVIRDPGTGRILSAQQQKGNTLLDAVHALLVRTDHNSETGYSCFGDFSEISGSSAEFAGESECELDGETVKCVDFYQSLNGVSGSSGSQNITFFIDPENLFIKQETIDYDLGALTMIKTTMALEKTETLPDDLIRLIGSIK